MTSFEGMRAGTGGVARQRGWRLIPLALAGVAAGAGLAIVLTAFASDESVAPTPDVAHLAITVPDGPVALTPPMLELPAGFTLELPTAFTDNFELPAPVVEPEPAPVVEPEAVPVSPVNAGAPAANPPVATKPVEPAQPAPAPAPAEKPNFYVPEVSGGGITNLEQRLLDGINAQRANAGLSPYTYDAGLSRVARTRSQQMTDQGYFGHVDPYGYSMYTELLARFGFGYAWAGENLALNNYGVAESPERAVIALMKSPTHAANILAGDFYRIGIGEVTTADGRHIYAMIFLG